MLRNCYCGQPENSLWCSTCISQTRYIFTSMFGQLKKTVM